MPDIDIVFEFEAEKGLKELIDVADVGVDRPDEVTELGTEDGEEVR